MSCSTVVCFRGRIYFKIHGNSELVRLNLRTILDVFAMKCGDLFWGIKLRRCADVKELSLLDPGATRSVEMIGVRMPEFQKHCG